ALFLLKEKFPSLIFIIFGEGEKRAEYEEHIKIAGLEKNVILFGKLENAPKYLKAFDIFTLTSITEGLPYVLLEAGQAELPVIASNVGGILEVVDQLHSGILSRPEQSSVIK